MFPMFPSRFTSSDRDQFDLVTHHFKDSGGGAIFGVKGACCMVLN